MTDIARAASTPLRGAPPRQIRGWGSAARLVVGLGALIAAATIGTSGLDILIGLVILPMVELGLVATRGTTAPPLRLHGNAGHGINWGIGILLFSFVPVAALLLRRLDLGGVRSRVRRLRDPRHQ